MTENLSPLARDLLSGVTDEAVAAIRGYREDLVPVPQGSPEATALPPDWQATISTAAYEFIVRWETGGRAYYEHVILGRPVWPGFSSGITIGCGYDLGYHALPAFRRDWESRIPRAASDRLARTIGFRTVEPDRPAKVATAKALIESFADIVVPWPVAIEQFDTGKLPALVADLYRSLDNLDLLHPHARGALLSLVFNRGPSFATPGPRHAEMRDIAAAMREGTPHAFARIPGLLRDMRRIWGLDSSLAQRRDGEATLFEAGLAEARLVAGLGRPSGGVEATAPGRRLVEVHGDVEAPQSDVAEEVSGQAADDASSRSGPEAAAASTRVRWNPVDDEQPDYRHLDTRLAFRTAEILPEDLEALIASNAFAPKPGRVVFGLRGAALVGGDRREDVASFTITDQRPDHAEFRCVMGAYDPARRRFWVYQASTVPNAEFVLKCYRDFRAGVGLGALTGNILPTGCYIMTVGTHRRGQPGEIPAVLRLSTTADGASRVVVLRSLEDACYDRFDRFLEATPGDNIHPAQRNSGFSSAGCLTLPGHFANGQHSGAWKAFRTAVGFDETTVGRQVSLVLLTGLDAVMAAEARRAGTGMEALRRLRHGSQGAAVARLQAALGLAPDASQLIGPITRAALVRAQAARLGWADGIHAPAMDTLLGFSIFAEGGPEAAASPEAAGTPGVAAAAPATADDLTELLEAWRAGTAAGGQPVRFVASFDGQAPKDAELAAAASARLGLAVIAGPLFAPDPDLDRFRLLRIEGVSRPERADLFDVAAALRQALGATAVEPDLGTDYFAEPLTEQDRGQPESADLTFWCWADERRDKPHDPDWAITSTGVRTAWAMTPAPSGAARGKGILVFQPDTGVVPDHVELPPGLATDPRAGNFVEGSGNGNAVDPRSGGSNPGHGTGTASVVVSPAGGAMVGAAPDATLVPVRCIETVAVFDQSPVAQAIDYARRQGAHVITMSLGGVPSMALHAALRRAVEANVIVVAAAGNCVSEVVWPARYGAAIAVAGVSEADRPWRGSSHGPDVDISGPAEFVLRADGRDPATPPAAVSGGQGTSFATAMTAGIAALWLAHHGRDRLIGLLPPGWRLQDLFRALLRASAHVTPGHDPHEFGPGVVRADRLLALDPAAFAAATEAPAAATADARDGLASLLGRVFGGAGQEAAGRVLLPDRQHVAEIACVALDRARVAGTRRAFLESLPPPDLSIALRRRLGGSVDAFR